MLETGLPQEHVVFLSVAFVPFELMFTTYIGKHINGPDTLLMYFKGYPFRIFFALCSILLIFVAPKMGPDMPIPVYFYVSFILIYIFNRLACIVMFSSKMAFFAKCSRLNPHIGGTYMTILNTIANLGTYYLGLMLSFRFDV